MDSKSKRHSDMTRRLRMDAELDLNRALNQAGKAAQQIAALYKDDDLDLLNIIKTNRGDISPPIDGHRVMEALLKQSALKQLYVNHDERKRHENPAPTHQAEQQ